MTWKAYVSNYDRVYQGALNQMPDIVDRALQAGAQPPLIYVGVGMTSVVFCDQRGHAFKTARETRPIDRMFLTEEAEWLHTASRVIGVREHVAKLYKFHPAQIVIERECPMQAEDWWRHRGKEWDLHRLIEKRMIPFGWTAPEFKEDSYVITSSGPILVDASMPSRVGRRVLRFTIELIRGERILERGGMNRPSDYAFHIRGEVRNGTITEKAAAPVLRALAVLEEHGNRFVS